jgi:PKD repeat protein
MNPASLSLLASFLLASTAFATNTEQWGLFETTANGPHVPNPSLDVQWSAIFTHGDQRITVPGFWDGENHYKIRFSPPVAGEWRYETKSNAPELNGKSGHFTATVPTGNNHGPLEVFQKFYLRHADGTPHHSFGTTCYVWTHQTPELQEQTLRTLARSPFNKIRFCIFPKSYTYNRNEPDRFPFQKRADGTFDFTRPDPLFWRHLEQRILDLQQLGIQADLILWHPYDRWGFADMGAEHDDRYLRYAIARLGAYRNVWWSLANEFDLMAPGAMANHRGDKQTADWDRFFRILQQEDPHQRLRGIHNCRGFYDHTQPWVTHVSVQHGDLLRVLDWRLQYQKPVVVDECGYEGNIPEGWGRLSPQEMVRRFWIGTLNGGFVGHGETYRHPQDLLWWSKGGVLHGQSPMRIQWLRDLIAQAPPFHQLQPQRTSDAALLLAKPGHYYLLYALRQQPITLHLPGNNPYKLDLVDPWNMTVSALGSAPAGEFTVPPHQPDLAYRFTPYSPDEPLRPDAILRASTTEGTPPLTVQFEAVNAHQSHWNFGDGTISDSPRPTHTFRQPGLYSVQLTVTNPNGDTARNFVTIAVDRNTTVPVLRAGFPDGELPTLKPQGTASRGTDGSLRLPAGAPWGWVDAGDDASDLRGLRSFTILGWLKPESLQVGSGGNRIVFCLNGDHSGIDLVCHADGRLRLAVNQWPDGIRNDSSPGKLQPGKWTFFAVTYDATLPRDNVSWHFSPPLDAPGPAQPFLDRTTTYNVGPVGTEIGPLVIGNFNHTMRNHGLDRQFRGEIRSLQIFGSRVGSRGARTPQEIQSAMILRSP